MSYYILAIICFIILIAYIFELTSRFSKIPGVILLMSLGLGLRYLSNQLNISIPDLSILLPVMGTLGLILIVLEGSLDLTISRENLNLIKTSFASAAILLVIFIVLFGFFLCYFEHFPIRMSILNAIPFGIISGAVAIPSALYLNSNDREFIVYESSVSDILGILLFNFMVFNELTLGKGIVLFIVEVIVSVIFSLLISLGLAFMLHKIGHHVKYVIIITLVILVYVLANLIHWPSLLVVLIFGLILNNNRLFQTKYIKNHIDIKTFNINLRAFKQITGELTFLVRSFFFLIFGFYTSIVDLLNLQNLISSVSIIFSIFLLRGLFLRFILHKPLTPLFYFAPRGLITILLFLSIPAGLKLPFMSEGLITQIIFITIFIMVFGNFISQKKLVHSE